MYIRVIRGVDLPVKDTDATIALFNEGDVLDLDDDTAVVLIASGAAVPSPMNGRKLETTAIREAKLELRRQHIAEKKMADSLMMKKINAGRIGRLFGSR